MRDPVAMSRFRLLLLMVVCAVTAACTHARNGIDDLPSGDWRLSSDSGVAQTLSFGADGRVSGDAGCNRWSATLETHAAGVMRLGPVMATKRACLDEAANRREAAFLELLGDVRGYRQPTMDQLQLLGAEGEVLATLRR